MAHDISEITYYQAFIIGLCQTVAIVPGVSRAAATIVGGLSLGIKRATIVQFSFLLAVPTMLMASGLDFVKSYLLFSGDQFSILTVSFFISLVAAFLSIKFLLSYIQKHTFISFGVYRIVVAIFFFFII